MVREKNIEGLLVRAYGRGQPGLSKDEEASLVAHSTPSRRKQGEPQESARSRRSAMPKILSACSFVAVVLAGVAGYGLGTIRSEKPQLDGPLPGVVFQLPQDANDGPIRDLAAANCAPELTQPDMSLTGVTCTWNDGGAITLTPSGIR